MLRGNVDKYPVTRRRLIHHRVMQPGRFTLFQQRDKVLLVGENLHTQILLRELFKRYIKLFRRLLVRTHFIPREACIIQKFAKFFVSLSPILNRISLNPSHPTGISHRHTRTQSLKEIILMLGTQSLSMVSITRSSRHKNRH